MSLTQNQVRRNLIAYYVSVVDVVALMVVAVVQLWLLNGLSFAQILLLQGIFGLFVVLLEYPSGIWADITSRKNLLVIANIAVAAGSITYMFSDTFLEFCIAELFFAIGIASASGSNTAAVYDTYVQNDEQERGDTVLANGKVLMLGSTIIMVALGGVLFTVNLYLPFMLTAAGALVSGGLYAISVEPERVKVESSSAAVRKSLGMLKIPKMVNYMIAFLFLSVYLRIAFWAYIPSMEDLGMMDYWHGLVLAGANVVAFLSSIVARRYKNTLSLSPIMAIGVIGLIVFMNHSSVVLLLLAIAMHQVVRGSYNVLLVIRVNQQIGSELRASMLSLFSSVGFGTYFIATLVFNVLGLSQAAILVTITVMGLLTWLVYLAKNGSVPKLVGEVVHVSSD